ncbi:hypothetical protein [Staphylococcus kloosii]|jgi:hypothetical protein|uniref:hypothetical protein n=1 Tax=Staphylococcus kloosii TaxID=29384 RepID=UPI00189F62FD|nr:hypothetical protein [Staphylococcus kloosii]MBF7025699.1 hypothetical protein [Staphylococcus kloosii]
MNYITTYLNDICKNTYEVGLKSYKEKLDLKLESIEQYIAYLIEKKERIRNMIDSLTLKLENKYIDMIDYTHVNCAQEIENNEIDSIKAMLNKMEADYARIEADLSQQAKEKINTETECDFIERISLVA